MNGSSIPGFIPDSMVERKAGPFACPSQNSPAASCACGFVNLKLRVWDREKVMILGVETHKIILDSPLLILGAFIPQVCNLAHAQKVTITEN